MTCIFQCSQFICAQLFIMQSSHAWNITYLYHQNEDITFEFFYIIIFLLFWAQRSQTFCEWFLLFVECHIECWYVNMCTLWYANGKRQIHQLSTYKSSIIFQIYKIYSFISNKSIISYGFCVVDIFDWRDMKWMWIMHRGSLEYDY